MSSTEFDHWYSVHRDKPLHQETLLWQLAHIAAGSYGGKPSDYFPEHRRPKTVKQQIAIWQSMG
ncbi:hypothetical protein [Microbulbifer agarilyticus]|nr:hypothetical protein [Microbulbifer agarilyticus]